MMSGIATQAGDRTARAQRADGLIAQLQTIEPYELRGEVSACQGSRLICRGPAPPPQHRRHLQGRADQARQRARPGQPPRRSSARRSHGAVRERCGPPSVRRAGWCRPWRHRVAFQGEHGHSSQYGLAWTWSWIHSVGLWIKDRRWWTDRSTIRCRPEPSPPTVAAIWAIASISA